MDLSPSSIRNHTFSRALRGLDAGEVSGYLDRVADRLDAVTAERQQMKSRIEKLEAKVERYGAVARVLDETIDDTNRSTEQLVQDVKAKLDAAQQDADEVTRSAEEQARMIRRKTAELHEKIREEADAVVQERRDLAERNQKLMQITAQLVNVVGGEIEATPTASPTTAPSSDGASDAVPPTLYAGGSTNEASSDRKKKERTKQEWIDSLFPNRLGAGQKAAVPSPPKETPAEPASARPAEGQKSSGSSHFEAIKRDVQSQEKEPTGRSDGESEKPSTNELERIWDIFDES